MTVESDKNQFLISDHESMVENLNRISDDLLKSYWHFLATIAALGTAYKYAYEHQEFIFVICLVGNIIFWLIGEYALSHGFLFRFIQTKMAKIEKQYYTDAPKIKDPTDISNFIATSNDKKYLQMDHVIPDQFIPIYWASIWLLIINTVFAIFFYTCEKSMLIKIALALSSLLLIWKLYIYYLYKIKKFIGDLCDFKFFIRKNSKKKDLFAIPYRWFFPSLFLFAFVGILIHIFRYIFHLPLGQREESSQEKENKTKYFSPEIVMEKDKMREFTLEMGSFHQTLLLLYLVV